MIKASPSRRVRGVVVALLAGTVLCASIVAQPAPPNTPDTPGTPGSPAQESPSVQELMRSLDRAYRSGSSHRVHAALEALAREDSGRATAAGKTMIVKGTLEDAAIACGVLGRLADPRDIVELIGELQPSRHREARTWLVRALGVRSAGVGEDAEAAKRAVPRLVGEGDMLVRAEAINALAATKDPRAIRALPGNLPVAPGTERFWSDPSEQGRVTFATYGVVRALLGIRPQGAREVKDFIANSREAIDKGEPLPAIETVRDLRSDDRMVTRYFDVFFNHLSTSGGSSISDDALGQLFDSAASDAIGSATPIFGTIALPTLRLLPADANALSSTVPGAPTGKGFAGVSSGNAIGIRFSRPELMRMTLTHEMIHAIHLGRYRDQPRWLSEGLAKSLTESPRSSKFHERGGRRSHHSSNQGPVSALVNWTSGASTDEREGQRYALAHMVVDYLRFRGFPEPEVRLHFLMGTIGRGLAVRQVFEGIYGMPLREMDEDFTKWFATGETIVGP